MIECQQCGRFAQMTYHEQIETCPYCASDSWHIYHLQAGHMPTHNMRAMKAIKQSPVPPRGRCFLTPRGRMVSLGLLRGGSDDDGADEAKDRAKREGG